MPTKKHLNLEDKLRPGRKKIRMKVSGKSTFSILEILRGKKQKRTKR